MTDGTLQQAYDECQSLASTHYENFPTASRLLSKPQRRATAAIYSFARRADDFADEGNVEKSVRHANLDRFSGYLGMIDRGDTPDDMTFVALADVIRQYQLPVSIFERLLTAFRMDVDKQRYEDFDALMAYCHCSADPVGELVLRIHDYADDENIHLSNRICSALQLINFIQDIDEDFQQRGRIYIPLNEMNKFGVKETQLNRREQNSAIESLLEFQIKRAKAMLLQGAPLIDNVHGRIRWMLAITLNSALRIVHKLEARKMLYERPRLMFYDWPLIFIRSLYRP